MLGRRTAVKPIEERVVFGVHEELGTTAVGTAIRHAQSPHLIGESGTVEVLVLDAVARAARAAAGGVGVLGVRATALQHESLDDSVEVETVIVALVGEVEEISRRNRHAVGEQFDGDVTLAGLHQDLRHILRAQLPVLEPVPSSALEW